MFSSGEPWLPKSESQSGKYISGPLLTRNLPASVIPTTGPEHSNPHRPSSARSRLRGAGGALINLNDYSRNAIECHFATTQFTTARTSPPAKVAID